VLRTLAVREDLLDELDDAIRHESAARVRAAWVSRKGRSIDEIVGVLDGESRQSVLEVVAATPGLPDEVYSVVADRATGARALCAVITGDAPAADKLRCAHRLLRLDSPKIPRVYDSAVREYVLGIPELRRATLTEGTAFSFVDAVWRNVTDDDVEDLDPSHLVAMLVLRRLDEAYALRAQGLASGFNHGTGSAIHRCWVNAVAAVESLETRFVVDDDVCDQVVALGREMLDAGASWQLFKHTLDGARGTLERFERRHNGVAEELAALAERARAGGADGVAAVRRIIDMKQSNDSAARAMRTLSTVAGAALDHDVLAVVVTEREGWRAAVRHADLSESPLLMLFAEHCPASELPLLMSAASSPRAGLEAWSRTPNHSADHLWILERSRPGFVAEHPDVLPANVLIEPVRPSEMRSAASAAAMRYVIERFGSNAAAWNLAGELADGTVGTVDDVCDMVAAALLIEG
jgi:hypothetical protein